MARHLQNLSMHVNNVNKIGKEWETVCYDLSEQVSQERNKSVVLKQKITRIKRNKEKSLQ